MKTTRTTRNAGWLVVAGLLGAALIAPAGAAADGHVYATVTGHVASSTGSPNPNQVAYWEAMGYKDCTKIDIHTNDPQTNVERATYPLEMSYDLVVVKAETGEFANTLFEDASAGELVFADTNGNFESDPRSEGVEDGDHNISHIIFCDPVQTTTTTTVPSTTTTTTTVPSTTTTTTTVPSTTTTTTTVPSTTTTTTSSVASETTSQTTSTSTTVTGTVSGETGDPTPPSTDTVAFSSTSSTTGSGWSLLLVAMAGLLAAALLLTPAVERKR